MNTTQEISLERTIELTLRRLQIGGTLRGHRYLATAILETVRDPERVILITKSLYPDIARQYRTTPSCVERSMRHAIAKAWENGGAEDLEEVTQVRLNQRPTNAEFIDLLANTLRYAR